MLTKRDLSSRARSGLRLAWPWIAGFAAFLWVLLRSGANPKRLIYPCQRAAFPIAAGWVLAVLAFFAGNLLVRRFAKLAGVGVLAAGIVWFVGAVPRQGRADERFGRSLPVWEVEDPVSTVFIMDNIPPTAGSLAGGGASVPDEYLVDPAIDTLLMMMETQDIVLHKTEEDTSGIVGADDVVIIKGNFQWTSRNTTSTDRIKGLIWQILQHPDGFAGEIIVCDNTQQIGTGINHSDNNSEDPDQSIIDVVSTFFAKGYPVYSLDWRFIWDTVAEEYSTGDYKDGYIYETDTKISYPKFRSPSGEHCISLRYGLWDSLSTSYDLSRLCIIDFPVLKAHASAGSTIGIKNWIGTLTTAYANERYGGSSAMHTTYFWGTYALVARVMAVTFPRLTIVDAAWTTTYGPNNLNWLEETEMLAVSTDPAAVSWYTAKFMLTPIARYPYHTNPDQIGGAYHTCIERWTTFLRDSAGFPCTRDSLEMSVYDRSVLYSTGVDGGTSAVASDVDILHSYPNPFTAATTVPVTLARGQPVRLAVYDVAGREVRLVSDGFRGRGEHEIEWDGLDGSGEPLPSGVYFIRAEGARCVRSQKIVLLR